jgi:hypothetical protein
MPGYLERYGQGHEQRARRTRRIIASALVVIVGGASLYFYMRNYRQKAKVTQFVELLQKQDYTGSYRLWGCTETKPCPDYAFNRFMEDWGPQSPNAKIDSFEITRSRACGSGVIVTVDLGRKRLERFWVEGSEMTIGYSPWQVCPAR